MKESDEEQHPENSVDDAALYGITVASELVGVGEQTLRLYEQKGLVEPARTPGGTRRYSNADVRLLRRVGGLLAEGVNLAGARRVLALETANKRLQHRLAELTKKHEQSPGDAQPPEGRRPLAG